jgi:putative oxidoreductase
VDTVIDALVAVRRLVRAITDRLQWLPPTLARLTVGWIFFWSGWGKLHSLDRVIEYFGSLGIPHPELQAPFASATEFVCGVLMLAGLFTRLASIPLVIVMLVAIATAQRENVSGLGDLFGLSEYLYITLLVWLGVGGAGPFSLDHALVRWVGRDRVRDAPVVGPLATPAR